MKTLKLESSSFIDDDLRESYSDVLWSVKTEQGPGYIYCLIEHQSTSNKLIAFRMMRYAIAAMQNHLDAGYKTLPMVVPLLFYHGIESPYPYSLCWLDCFADPNLARQLYASAFPLIDVTVMPDDEIMQHRRMALLELIQKHIRQRDLMSTGNDPRYLPYLKKIGAAKARDDIFAAIVFCPITLLSHADEAYEWVFKDETVYHQGKIPGGMMQPPKAV